MSVDPAETNPDHYKVIFENDRVRVLEYTDQPGTVTTPHAHPDSVMYTQHHGENIGETPTHAIFVELKDSTEPTAEGEVGPRLLRGTGGLDSYVRLWKLTLLSGPGRVS